MGGHADVSIVLPIESVNRKTLPTHSLPPRWHKYAGPCGRYPSRPRNGTGRRSPPAVTAGTVFSVLTQPPEVPSPGWRNAFNNLIPPIKGTCPSGTRSQVGNLVFFFGTVYLLIEFPFFLKYYFCLFILIPPRGLFQPSRRGRTEIVNGRTASPVPNPVMIPYYELRQPLNNAEDIAVSYSEHPILYPLLSSSKSQWALWLNWCLKINTSFLLVHQIFIKPLEMENRRFIYAVFFCVISLDSKHNSPHFFRHSFNRIERKTIWRLY